MTLKNNFAKFLSDFWQEISSTSEEGFESLEILVKALEEISINDSEICIHKDEFNKLFSSLHDLDMSRKSSADFNESLLKLNNYINWYPNNVYKNPDDAIKHGNYCANLVGKKRDSQSNPFLFHSDNVLVGLFLLGKGNLYPEHKHPAKEMWVVLSGEAKWKRGGEEWLTRKAGEYFMHTSNQSHAMQTLDEPLLAMWAWTGDLEKWAEWTDCE